MVFLHGSHYQLFKNNPGSFNELNLSYTFFLLLIHTLAANVSKFFMLIHTKFLNLLVIMYNFM